MLEKFYQALQPPFLAMPLVERETNPQPRIWANWLTTCGPPAGRLRVRRAFGRIPLLVANSARPEATCRQIRTLAATRFTWWRPARRGIIAHINGAVRD